MWRRGGRIRANRMDRHSRQQRSPIPSPLVFPPQIIAVIAHLDHKIDCGIFVVKLKVLHVVPAVHP